MYKGRTRVIRDVAGVGDMWGTERSYRTQKGDMIGIDI